MFDPSFSGKFCSITLKNTRNVHNKYRNVHNNIYNSYAYKFRRYVRTY